jgi:hypothetical protein
VARLEQDVLGLDVAVDKPQRMGVAQGVGHLAGNLERVVERELSLAGQPVAEGFALHEGHRVVEKVSC